MKYEMMNAGTVMGVYRILMKLVEWWYEKEKKKRNRNMMHMTAFTGTNKRR